MRLALAVMAVSASCRADDWFGEDKALHFGVSVSLSAAAATRANRVVLPDPGGATTRSNRLVEGASNCSSSRRCRSTASSIDATASWKTICCAG